MRRVVVLFGALVVFGVAGQAAAQSVTIDAADLAATWQLVSVKDALTF